MKFTDKLLGLLIIAMTVFLLGIMVGYNLSQEKWEQLTAYEMTSTEDFYGSTYRLPPVHIVATPTDSE